MQFRFRPETAKEVAKELRRASIGVAAASYGLFLKEDNIAFILLAFSGWSVLQILAFLADNLED